MDENQDFRLFTHFLGHIFIATVLFFAVIGAAVALETFADWIERHQYSRIISLGCHAVAYIIFFLDIGCLLFFLTIQALKFVKEIWASFKG